jgi:hypothetical protein
MPAHFVTREIDGGIVRKDARRQHSEQRGDEPLKFVGRAFDDYVRPRRSFPQMPR